MQFGSVLERTIGIVWLTLVASVSPGAAQVPPGGCIDQGINITYATDLVIDSAGNVYVTGGSRVPTGESEYLTVKYDPQGTMVWRASYQGAGRCFDYATAIDLDSVGNVLVTGKSWSTGRRSGYATIKYDSNGLQRWVVRYDSSSDGRGVASGLVVDAAGNVHVTGSSPDPGGGSSYATAKYSADGQELWVARYGPSPHSAANDLALDEGGNVYITGSVASVDQVREYATVKYAADGHQIWNQHFKAASGGDSQAHAVDADPSGVYVTGASCRIPASQPNQCSNYQFATIKYDASGNQLWLSQVSPDAAGSYQAFALALDSAGQVYVTGSSGAGEASGYTTVKFDPAGNQLWHASYRHEGFDVPHDIAVSRDGTINVTGGSLAGSTLEYATVAYDSNGTESWVSRYRGPDGRDYDALALGVDPLGNIIVTGGTLDQSGAFGSAYATVKYDSAGHLLWATDAGIIGVPGLPR